MDFFGQSEPAKTLSGQCQTSNIQVLPSDHIRPVFFSGSNWLKQNRDTKNKPDLSCYISQSQFQRLKQQRIMKTVATSASARLTMDTWDTVKACLIQQSLCWCVLNMYVYKYRWPYIYIIYHLQRSYSFTTNVWYHVMIPPHCVYTVYMRLYTWCACTEANA